MSLDTREKSRNSGNPVELYRIQNGSTVYRYAAADLRISVDVAGDGLQTYVPEAISRGELTFSQEETAGMLDVTVPRWNPIAQLFIPFTSPTPVKIKVFRVHPDDGEVIVAFIGRIVRAEFAGSEAKLSCAPLAVELRRAIPRIACQVACNWSVYSPGCTLDPNSFKDVGTIASVSGFDVTATVFASRADGYFDAGYLELADGTTRYITSHVGNRVTLQAPIIGLTVGTAFSAFPGCDLTEATCLSKFNNLANHLGFKRIPTRNPYELGMT